MGNTLQKAIKEKTLFPPKSSPLVFYVNGEKVIEEHADPEWTLLMYLRNKLRLSGTKLGCAEGGCGACTVMIQQFDRGNNKIVNYAVTACLTPVCAVHGTHVITVEGIGNLEKGLHPVQDRIAKNHGSQCGFCTSGMVMSMYTLLRNKNVPMMSDMDEALQGNLCRCTGYRAIIEGFKTFTSESGAGGGRCGACKCCIGSKINGNSFIGQHDGPKETSNSKGAKHVAIERISDTSSFKPYDPDSEPIFPLELQLDDRYDSQLLIFRTPRVTWYRPVRLDHLLELKVIYPRAKLLVGNTEIGIEVKFENAQYPIIIQITRIPELTAFQEEANGVRFGAAVTLSKMGQVLCELIASRPAHKTRVLKATVEALRWLGSKQIRNVASVGGCIVMRSISDLRTLFMAAHCELVLKCKDETRVVHLDDTFFNGYRKNILKPEEIIASILIPYTNDDEYFFGFKQTKRRDVAPAIVNAGMFVHFLEELDTISHIRLAYGGMGETTVVAHSTAHSLIGKPWTKSVIDIASKTLIDDLPLASNAPEGMIEFRRSLTLSFFFKFFLLVQNELSLKLPYRYIKPLATKEKSAIQFYHRKPLESVQLTQIVPENQPEYDLVGRPIPHLSAMKQASGEAIYIDDMPKFENELYLALVFSTRAHAKILDVDPTEALGISGVVDFLSAKDIPRDRNKFGAVIRDETVFAINKVTCVGHVIGAVIAIDQSTAQRGAKAVKINYEDIHPSIITIQDAIRQQSFFHDFTKSIKKGDMKKGLAEADHILEGEMHMGGQEHFYMETQAAIAIPMLEDGEIELICSTQNPSEIQLMASEVLGVPENRIVVRTKRMGGGFGGKETRNALVVLPVAVAANKLKRPIRCMLDRDEDMGCSGNRHPFFCKYEVGFKSTGKVTALKLTMYSNAGNSLDLSASVMEGAVLNGDSSYLIPNVDFTGFLCKTNLPSNTAFRGFGSPQGLMCAEYVMSQVADKLGMDPVKLRKMNMYKEGDSTHYNQVLKYSTLSRCWKECLANSNYTERLSQVEEFNRENRWRKRGLSVTPTKLGIAFALLHLNQAGALVLIYRDGSVLLSHGGTEMGQGLHTKMIQVASRALQVHGDKIHIADTATDKVPNTSATAASTGSDLNGMAVLNACTILKERLEPYRKANPKGKWEDWVNAAYHDRVSLSAAGFYKTPGIRFDPKTMTGTHPFNYFCFGAACAEVEIDCLTGDHEVRRVDIVMDVGESLNPAIDIGQIEGAFMQGYGLFTLEELHFSPEGVLLTKGPGTYKIPAFGNIPQKFNVTILRGAPNPKAVYSSKAVGEPPLFLAASVFFALKHAIKAARAETGLTDLFRLDSPATAERIRMACQDQYTFNFPHAPIS